MVAHQTKIRISKHEIRHEVTRSEAKALTISAQQYQMAKIQMTKTPHHARAWPQKDGSGCMFQTLRHSNFEFVSDFDIRISSLRSSRIRWKRQSLFNSHPARRGGLNMIE